MAIVRELLQSDAPEMPFRVDERVLKPRVAGLIAVGGSLTSQWKTLALPVLHTITFSMQTAMVDQVVFAGAGRALDRARRRGAGARRAARAQRGRAARPGVRACEYRGDAGLCPYCHLDVIVLRGSDVECATCGARGELTPDGVRFTPEGSVITLAEKEDHFREIRDTAARHAERRDEIESRARVRGLRPPRHAVSALDEQRELWSAAPRDWAEIAEPENESLFARLLDACRVGAGSRLLDVACGSGFAAMLAAARGASVAGVDVTPALLEIARERTPAGDFREAGMDELPFGDACFDVVTGVNGFQFALDPAVALGEAARVLVPGGRLGAATFAEPERNEGTALHLAMKALVDEPADDGYTPYALSSAGGLEGRCATPASPSRTRARSR